MIGSPVSLPLRDGVELSGLLWSPSGPGPFPALLMRQPYGARIASTVVYAHPSWYAQQGYLVLVLDVRGRGDSGGEFSGFATEATDGDDALAWLKSHPLCNGQVGSYGFSYQGLTQLLGSDPNLHPEALAPAMCGLDERLHWASEGGAHWWVLSLSWGLQLASESCRRRGDQQAWQAIKDCLASAQQSRHGLALLQQHDPSNPVLQWLQGDPSQAEGWTRHQPSPERLRRPMQLLEGWSDPYLRGGLDLWQQSVDCGGSPELIIGPWSHLSWDRRVAAVTWVLKPAATLTSGSWPFLISTCAAKAGQSSPAAGPTTCSATNGAAKIHASAQICSGASAAMGSPLAAAMKGNSTRSKAAMASWCGCMTPGALRLDAAAIWGLMRAWSIALISMPALMWLVSPQLRCRSPWSFGANLSCC